MPLYVRKDGQTAELKALQFFYAKLKNDWGLKDKYVGETKYYEYPDRSLAKDGDYHVKDGPGQKPIDQTEFEKVWTQKK